jgi:hypothetical protein
MIRWLVGAIGLSLVATQALAADPLQVGIGYLRHAGIKETLSMVEQPAPNDGVAGAQLAIEDNNTTGKFTNQHFTLDVTELKPNDDAVRAATSLAGHDGFIILDLPADEILKVADGLRERGTVLFNAGSIDDRLREQDCRDYTLVRVCDNGRGLQPDHKFGLGLTGMRERLLALGGSLTVASGDRGVTLEALVPTGGL